MSVERRYPALKHTHTADQIDDLVAWLSTNLSAAFTTAFGVSDTTKFFRGDKTWSSTLTGRLDLTVPTSEMLRMAASGPYMTFYDAAGSTRRGYFQHTGTHFALVNETAGGAIDFYTGASTRARIMPTGDFRSRSQGRFTGWYTTVSTDENGPGMEVGYNAGIGYVGSYDRTTSTYKPFLAYGTSLTLQPSSANVIIDQLVATSPTLDIQSPTGGPWGLRLYRKDIASGAQMYWDGTFLSHDRAGAFAGPVLASNGWLQVTGWSGVDSYRQGGQFGYTGGFVYVHAYNGTSYLPMRITGSSVDINNSDLLVYGKIAVTGNDSWLRLNNSSQFASGVYTPTLLRADGGFVLSSYTMVNTSYEHLGAGFRWHADNNFYLYNISGYTYGSWRVNGTIDGSYRGIMLHDNSDWRPTFMTVGTSATGIYYQGASRWVFYDDNTYLRTYRKLLHNDANAYFKHAGSYTSGDIYIQSGGSPSGGSDGDIFLIY